MVETGVDVSALVSPLGELAAVLADRSEVAGLVAGRDATTVPTGRVNTAASSSQSQPPYPQQQYRLSLQALTPSPVVFPMPSVSWSERARTFGQTLTSTRSGSCAHWVLEGGICAAVLEIRRIDFVGVESLISLA